MLNTVHKIQGTEDKVRFHASGVWCSHTMWGRIQRVLEERLEKMESLQFDAVQLRTANHRALEDNRMQSILTDQQMSIAQREFDMKVRRMPERMALHDAGACLNVTACDYRFKSSKAASQVCKINWSRTSGPIPYV